ncbi:MAG: hypothetical protein DCC71_14190 [Proteobacteria bacterium]|nr:MAG: hypothetical protein DCC71_14190 [Pseudomonadota bacterium]
MLRAGAALVRDPDPAAAARRAAEQALAAGNAADAAFVFATAGADLAPICAAVQDVLGTRATAAAAGHAIAAGEHEQHAGPAVAVLALAGMPAAAFAVPGEPGAAEAVGLEVESLLGRSACESDLVVVLADPLGLETAALMDGLAALAPAAVIGSGAAALPQRPVVASGGRPLRGGACGLVLTLPAPARIAISQGCRPITQPATATRIAGHWVLELDDEPALDRFRAVAGEPLAGDLRRAAESLLVAVPCNAATGAARNDAWIARRISGFDEARRAFAVAAPLRVGAALAFALRDPDFAREDLAHALGGMGPAAAGLHLCASDRGRALFRHEGLESALVARALAPAAVAALFGSFEIAPLAGSLAQLAHASVLVGFGAK